MSNGMPWWALEKSKDLGIMDGPLTPRVVQSTKLHNQFEIEKQENVNIVPPTCSSVQQKQIFGTKGFEKEELVKYMSNLPSYLERGEDRQEKALNVGVLGWHQLEKWQCSHKQVLCQDGKYSPSSSNTSSFSSSDGSSSHSCRGKSWSPIRQRMHWSMPKSHLNGLPLEGSESLQLSISKDEKFQGPADAPNSPLKKQQNIVQTYSSETMMQECKFSYPGAKHIHETEACQNLEHRVTQPSSKGKTKIQAYESLAEQEKLQKLSDNVTGNDCANRSKTLLGCPRHDPEMGDSIISHSSQVNGRRSVEANQNHYAEESKGVHPRKQFSGETYSSLIPCESEGIVHSHTKQEGRIDTKTVNISSKSSRPSPSPVKITVDPSKRRNAESTNCTIVPMNSDIVLSANGPDLKSKAVTSKARNLSPIRRLSISIRRIGKSSSSNEGDVGQQESSSPAAAKSGTGRPDTSSCSDDLANDKTSSANRSRSSPLRRLLDPFLKPKPSNSPHQSAEPLQSQNDSTLTNGVCKSSHNGRGGGGGGGGSSTSMKVKLDLTSCRKIDIYDSHQKEKRPLPTVQALLQVAVKNGLPLFTFAVEKKNDVLAATVRKLNASTNDDNSAEEDNSWIYTFFTVHEMKKKNGSWLNHGAKCKDNGYTPSIVAQMKVSNLYSNVDSHDKDQACIRESVLFAADLTQPDHQKPSFQPNDELAAIITKIPGKNIEDLNQGWKWRDNCRDMSSVGSQDQDLGTTVILPGGVHGLPSRGEPSPLIQRWKSGGSCDCGGWDMGCQIRVLASKTRLHRRSTCTKAHFTGGGIELFSQGEVVGERPMFVISPFKGGIFSVEFNSSLSHLQAFSICIAVLRSPESSELSTVK